MLPLLVQGIAMATFFLAMVTILLDGVAAAAHSARPRACPISRASPPAASPPRSSHDCGTGARRCTRAAWPISSSAYSPADAASDATSAQFRASPIRRPTPCSRAPWQQQAYLLASDDLFWISGWLSIAMIVAVWMARRAISGGATHAAAD